MNKARYEVTAQLMDAQTRQPMAGYSVITETGIRDEDAALCLVGIKGANTDADGRFLSTFFTNASSIPTEIEVHIEFRPGTWRCRVVPVDSGDVKTSEKGTVCVDLGRVDVDYNLCRVPTGEH